ncbi:RloB family protein [Actinomadura sp. DC4]|uniref:RloB family protein n=1 Tax=Actinomadura sp. DC4 TaxID=3055069 RepID=UPI0025AF3C4A|nr:RloB family protein [Actinomadura sp. DC4]MDN3353126.1 RloB family protein [Actinomadura sp. DC4]
MSGRRREGRTSRNPSPRRRLSRRVLIVCGGQKTEKQYLDGLKRAERNPSVSVAIKTNPRSPSEVVNHAHKLKRQSPEDFDDVWCVFDVDEFRDIDRAADLARRHRVGLAISNPCFELWLLLHFDDRTAYSPSYASLLPLLRTHLPDYDKTDLAFTAYATGIQQACSRARSLEPTGEAPYVNPSTGMWQVVELMRRT